MVLLADALEIYDDVEGKTLIDKSNGKFTAVCDCCFERSEEYDTYNEMRHGIAYEGWHCHYNEEEQAWEHYCVECRE